MAETPRDKLLVPSPLAGGNSVAPSEMLAWINQAIDENGISQQELGHALGGLSEPHVTRLRNGEKPWTDKKLGRLPDPIQRRVAQLWNEALGVPVDVASVLRSLADALDPLPLRANQMAKAHLSRAGPEHLQEPVQTREPARATGTGSQTRRTK